MRRFAKRMALAFRKGDLLFPEAQGMHATANIDHFPEIVLFGWVREILAKLEIINRVEALYLNFSFYSFFNIFCTL